MVAAADGFGNPLLGERHDAHLFSWQMLERFDPKYMLPTHKYFSKVAIPSLYVRTRETVTSELSETWEGEYVGFSCQKFVIVQLLHFVE